MCLMSMFLMFFTSRCFMCVCNMSLKSLLTYLLTYLCVFHVCNSHGPSCVIWSYTFQCCGYIPCNLVLHVNVVHAYFTSPLSLIVLFTGRVNVPRVPVPRMRYIYFVFFQAGKLWGKIRHRYRYRTSLHIIIKMSSNSMSLGTSEYLSCCRMWIWVRESAPSAHLRSVRHSVSLTSRWRHRSRDVLQVDNITWLGRHRISASVPDGIRSVLNDRKRYSWRRSK